MNWQLVGWTLFGAVYGWSLYSSTKRERQAIKSAREQAFIRGAYWGGYTGSASAVEAAAQQKEMK